MRTILTTCFILLLMVATIPAASAQQSDRVPDLAPGKHYVIEVQHAVLNRLSADGANLERIPVTLRDEADAVQPRIREFDTFSDAIFAATDGWVNLPEGSGPDALSLESSVGTASSTIIAIDYDGTYYGGSSLTWTVSNSHGCNTYKCGFLNLKTCWYNYHDSALGSAWNDRISSTDGRAGCYQNVLWEDQNYAGSRRECNDKCSTLGVMDNAASSRKWCPSIEEDFCD